MSTIRVFSETSLQFLEAIGERIQVSGGYRTLSLSTVASAESDETINIPDVLNSAETLEFCGLSSEVSRHLYDKWLNVTSKIEPGQLGHGMPLISLAREYIEGKGRQCNALTERDGWNEALEQQGLHPTTRGRILDVRFKNIRLTQSASYWALDTLNLSWEFLEGLDQRIQKTKEQAVLRSTSPDISTAPSRAMKQSVSPLFSALHEGTPLKLAVETEVPTAVEGRVLVYKGGSYTRLISIFRPDGSLNLAQIVSTPPCEFHPTRRDLYFTKQYDVALQYAEYVHTRVPPQEPAVLTAALPNEYTASSIEIFGPDWKKLVWLSRNNNALYEYDGILPQELDVYTEAEVLIGLTCGQGSDQINRMKSADELTVLNTKAGVKATQIMLNGSKMVGRFRVDCQGYVWIASPRAPKRATHFPLSPSSF